MQWWPRPVAWQWRCQFFGWGVIFEGKQPLERLLLMTGARQTCGLLAWWAACFDLRGLLNVTGLLQGLGLCVVRSGFSWVSYQEDSFEWPGVAPVLHLAQQQQAAHQPNAIDNFTLNDQ